MKLIVRFTAVVTILSLATVIASADCKCIDGEAIQTMKGCATDK